MVSYINFIDELEKRNSNKNPKSWFTYHSDEGDGAFYTANIVDIVFNNWIADGMKE